MSLAAATDGTGRHWSTACSDDTFQTTNSEQHVSPQIRRQTPAIRRINSNSSYKILRTSLDRLRFHSVLPECPSHYQILNRASKCNHWLYVCSPRTFRFIVRHAGNIFNILTLLLTGQFHFLLSSTLDITNLFLHDTYMIYRQYYANLISSTSNDKLHTESLANGNK